MAVRLRIVRGPDAVRSIGQGRPFAIQRYVLFFALRPSQGKLLVFGRPS